MSITKGCHKRSPGCGLPRWDGDLPGGCFAIREVVRQQHLPGLDGLVARNGDGQLDWTGKVVLLPDNLQVPLRWRRPHTVFVNDLSELFDDDVPDAFIAAFWCVAAWTSDYARGDCGRDTRPIHTYLILGKNHARMLAWLTKWADREQRKAMVGEARAKGWCDDQDVRECPFMPAVLSNVEIGVSAETQQWADIRVTALAQMPAARRFVSAEPLLGPIDFTRLNMHVRQQPDMVYDALNGRYGVPGLWQAKGRPPVDQVIVGGESKTGARPMHPQWVRDIRDQCLTAGVALFFKQWGEWSPDHRIIAAQRGFREHDWYHRPDRHLMVDRETGRYVPVGDFTGWETVGQGGRWAAMYRVGKKAAGAELDGRRWRQYKTTDGIRDAAPGADHATKA